MSKYSKPNLISISCQELIDQIQGHASSGKISRLCILTYFCKETYQYTCEYGYEICEVAYN